MENSSFTCVTLIRGFQHMDIKRSLAGTIGEASSEIGASVFIINYVNTPNTMNLLESLDKTDGDWHLIVIGGFATIEELRPIADFAFSRGIGFVTADSRGEDLENTDDLVQEMTLKYGDHEYETKNATLGVRVSKEDECTSGA